MSMNKKMFLNPKLFDKDVEQIPTRFGFGDGLVIAGTNDSNVVALCADLTISTKVQPFKEKFPDRFIEAGIAEQNMMGIAAGLALSGKVPFIADYSVFCPGRNWDQVRVSVCYSKANVKLTGAHSGISVGPDGATHQGLEDIATTRCLPNLVVMAPCDSIETKKATIMAAKYKGPVYLRFTREKTPVITTEKTPFKIGKSEVYRQGDDVAIIACGPLLYEALLAAKELEKSKIEASVVNCHTIKPLDKNIINIAKRCKAIVTVEEHQIIGGLGGSVAELLSKNYPVPIEFIGMPDCFGESGQPDELLKRYHMKSYDIIKAAKKAIARKRR